MRVRGFAFPLSLSSAALKRLRSFSDFFLFSSCSCLVWRFPRRDMLSYDSAIIYAHTDFSSGFPLQPPIAGSAPRRWCPSPCLIFILPTPSPATEEEFAPPRRCARPRPPPRRRFCLERPAAPDAATRPSHVWSIAAPPAASKCQKMAAA